MGFSNFQVIGNVVLVNFLCLLFAYACHVICYLVLVNFLCLLFAHTKCGVRYASVRFVELKSLSVGHLI